MQDEKSLFVAVADVRRCHRWKNTLY